MSNEAVKEVMAKFLVDDDWVENTFHPDPVAALVPFALDPAERDALATITPADVENFYCRIGEDLVDNWKIWISAFVKNH